MVRNKTLIVGIDDTNSSLRAVTYVAEVISDQQDFEITLFHVLPPIPPKLLEFGGAEDPDEERRLDAKLKKNQSEWVEEAKATAQPIMEKAKSILSLVGFSPDHISTVFSESIHRPDVVGELINTAHKLNCGTIVVGRQSYPLYQEVFHHHVGEELVRQGQKFAIWVIE